MYPSDAVSFTRSGCLGGYRIAGVQVAPLRYRPAQSKLELATRIRLEVHYETGRNEAVVLNESQASFAAGYARSLAEVVAHRRRRVGGAGAGRS